MHCLGSWVILDLFTSYEIDGMQILYPDVLSHYICSGTEQMFGSMPLRKGSIDYQPPVRYLGLQSSS